METTICAPATAQGGAISIIRVSGADSLCIADRIFSGRRSLADAAGYSVLYGNILDPDAENSDPQQGGKTIVDDVLVNVFRAPHSYTGEDSVEISCHGSAFITNAILNLLIKHGCTMAAPGEFTQRAFLNGKMDLSQAEAVADLIASQNAAQHRVAMSQMRGGISRKLAELHDKLLHLTSLLELELDFSDHEDLEFADRSELLSIAVQVEQEVAHLSDSYRQGNAIKNGIPVAIIGAPNVGKSTLLNALLQDDKAIVSDIAGTTRDTIEDTITINGILFRFVDTAGIRDTTDTIEAMGIDRSLKAADKAQIIILMRDPDNDYPTLTPRADQTVIRIWNKTPNFQAINGTGLSTLRHQLSATVSQSMERSKTDSTIITNLRHKQALDLAHQDIHRCIDALRDNLPGDLIAEDLRQCLSHLAAVTGRDITPDAVLTNIFQHFCIGK